MRDNGNQSLLNICSFKDSVNINPDKFARVSVILVSLQHHCAWCYACMRACVFFFFLSTLCLASSSHLQRRITPRNADRGLQGWGLLHVSEVLPKDWQMQIHSRGPKKKKKKKVSLSSGNDQMIPVHVTKSSSGRSDSCTKSYLTSKNPSSQSGFLLGPLMKIQQRDPGATRGEVLEGLPEAAARLMRSPQIDGGRQTPAKFR